MEQRCHQQHKQDEDLSEDDDYNAGEDNEEASLALIESTSTPPGAAEGTAVVGDLAVHVHEDQDDDYNDDYTEERRLSSQRTSQTECQVGASVLIDEGLISSQRQSQAEVPLTGDHAMPPGNDKGDDGGGGGDNDDDDDNYNDDYNSDNEQARDVQDLSTLDRNNDGVLTQAELNQAITEERDTQDQSPSGLTEEQLGLDECF